MESTLFVPNAIIFLYDVTNNDVQIPEYIDDVLISFNETCISVGTQADVDGEVALKLSSQITMTDKSLYNKVFNGSIKTPGKTLSISTSEEEGFISIDVVGQQTKVSIWTDDLNYPSIVLVEAT